MAEWAELIRALAELLWPIFAFTAAFLFKDEMNQLIKRLQKGKIFGQEIELKDSLELLHKSTENLSKEAASIPSVVDIQQGCEGDLNSDFQDEFFNRIYQEAARSPAAALILLAAEIEKEAKTTLACLGFLNGRNLVPIKAAVMELSSETGLLGHLSASLTLFLNVRDSLIHGGIVQNENLLSAIDSGVLILRSLQSIPSRLLKNYRLSEDFQSFIKFLQGVYDLNFRSATLG